MTIVNTSTRKTDLPASLVTRLDEVRRREASLSLTSGLIDALSLFLVALFFALVIDWASTLFSTSVRSTLTYLALGVGGVALVLLTILPRLRQRTLPELAASVDRSVPDLEERWETVTRLNESDDPESITGSKALFERVVAESVEKSRHFDAERVVPARRLRKHEWLLAAALGVNVVLFLIDPAQAWVLVKRFCSPTAPVSLTQIKAASGDLAVPRGEPVRLQAILTGRLRDKAELFLRNPQGQVTTVALSPNDAEGKEFVHAIDAADEPFSYRFRAGDGQTNWHDVSIYDRPRLTGVELRLTPPEYTHMPAITKSELPTSLRAVEGTQLEVSFSVDQPLGRFDMQLGTDSSQVLAPKAEDPLRYVFRTKLEKTLRLTPVFVSQHGLSNLRPPSCQVIVYPDRPPGVTIISPDREISLRPSDQVSVEFAARDDFGVVRAELVAFVGDQPDMKNAVVLPPQSAKGTNPKNVSAATGAATEPKQANTKDGKAQTSPQQNPSEQKTGNAANEPGSASAKPDKSAAQADKSAAEPDGKSQPSANGSKAPPQTVVIPIPLGAQSGEKNVRGKIKLDLKQFHLKQGQQLQYMVRVFDSHSAQSNGQSYGETPKSADSMAKGQEANKNQASDAARPASGPASAADSAKKSPSERVAQKGKREGSAARKNAQMADAADRKQSAPKNSTRDTAKTPASQSASSPSQQASTAKKTPPNDKNQGEMTGATPPLDSMPRRQLDVDSQSTASSTMKIHIDQYAGSFEGQQRQKLELAINPVLKELDAALAKAIEELRPISEAFSEGRKPADEEAKKSLRGADTQIARGQSLVADLVQKSEGTPYAFIGLQLVDITELHISPARLDVKAAKSDSPDRKDHVQHAEVHLTRAREMLADLTRKYESVKRDLKLADDMQRIKTMYQVFLENTMAFLAASRGTLNPKNRKMAELELDEEFLKQYRELAQEWEKTLAELAKVLAKDPRLLARYMSLSRRRVDTLRDQLTLLNLRQQELLVPVKQLSGEAPAEAAAGQKPGENEPDKHPLSPQEQTAAGIRAVQATLARDLGEIASETITVQEDLGTWLPQKTKEDQKTASLRQQSEKISSLATAAAMAVANPKADKSAAGKQVDALATNLKSFEAALSKLVDDEDSAMTLAVNRRLARVRKLQQLTAAWQQKNAHVAANRHHRVLEMDQHRLSEDTLALTGKLETANAQLAGLPDDILTLADEVKDAMRYDVLVEQMSAELGLRDGNLATAKAHQQKAIEGFTRAEERFNKLIDRVIEEQDKVPPQVPDLDNMQLATLEDLLARLESEADLAEELGIPNRPNNLQGLRDWLMHSGSGQGMGMGALQGRARLLEQARKDALRAAREAQKSTSRARPVATAAHWNTLGSRLEDAVRQGRGSMPPRQYRRAIERYFELISGAKGATENTPAAAPKENGKETANPAPVNPAGNR